MEQNLMEKEVMTDLPGRFIVSEKDKNLGKKDL